MSYRERTRTLDDAARTWHGSYRPYDLVKEATIALAGVTALCIVLAVLFSSPDVAPVTLKSWARNAPRDFVTTSLSELDGTSGTAGYGPPYNHASTGQHLWFVHLAQWLGVAHPIDAARADVIDPLLSVPADPALHRAVAMYQAAPAGTRERWISAYARALTRAPDTTAGIEAVSAPAGGPVGVMMRGLLGLAQTGGLDGALLVNRHFYTTDYTRILMFLADGGYLASIAQNQHLIGAQWGMMNETGSYPGQSWLWLYTFWYQIKPFSTSPNADILVMAIMGVLSLAFVCVPFIPGVRDLPRRIPIYRLIWRVHYRERAVAGR